MGRKPIHFAVENVKYYHAGRWWRRFSECGGLIRAVGVYPDPRWRLTDDVSLVTCRLCIARLVERGALGTDNNETSRLRSASFKRRVVGQGKEQLIITTVPRNPDELAVLEDLILSYVGGYVLPSASEEE